MVSTRPSSRITTPLPARSVPRICAVNASSGISARTRTTAPSAASRSKRQSSGCGRSSAGNAQSVGSLTAPPWSRPWWPLLRGGARESRPRTTRLRGATHLRRPLPRPCRYLRVAARLRARALDHCALHALRGAFHHADLAGELGAFLDLDLGVADLSGNLASG